MRVVVKILEWFFGLLGIVIIAGCIYSAIHEDPMWAIMLPVIVLCSWGMARLLIKLADR